MNMNPLILEYIHKAYEQEVSKKWGYKYMQDRAEKQKVCVNLGIVKFCI
jgi:hypothetical protein